MTRLTLLESPATVRPQVERPLSLLTQPGRPGHVLTAVELELEADTRKRLNSASVQCGVPAGLLAALSIESIRHLEHASSIACLRVDDLIEALNRFAAQRRGAPVIATEARRLTAYINALNAGGCSTALPRGLAMVPVIAPVAASWAVDAARVGQPVGRWAMARLQGDTLEWSLAWELAAASAGAPLGEWIQAAALRKLVTVTAHARM